MINSPKIIFALRWLTCAVFLGRAWQHLFFDIPLRSVLWDEYLMRGIVERFFKMEWESYISSPAVDANIQAVVVGLGIFYFLCAIAALLVKSTRKWLSFFLIVGSILLVLLAILYWKEKFQSIGQFLEYSLQFSTPLFLYFAIFKTTSASQLNRLIFTMKLAIALTFIGHGLYALGFYPVPNTYIEMMINVFGFSDVGAVQFLKIAGIVDLIAAIGLFIPRLSSPFLWYCIIWGTLTAFARVIANFYWEIPLESLHQWAYATVYRLPHGGIPLVAWWLSRKN